ncbi:hypothetical protein [Streptomyces sp. NPDC002537]
MGWRSEVDKALKELGEIRRRLDDPVAGPASLHRDLDHVREKLLDAVSANTAELRLRQDKMLRELTAARAELRTVRLETAQALAVTATATGDCDEERLMVHGEGSGSEPPGDGTPVVSAPDDDVSEWRTLKQAAERSCLDPGAAAPPSPPQQTAGDGPREPESPQVAHGALLLTAAGMSHVELVCHRDTWEFVAGQAAGHQHFRTPPAVQDIKGGRIQADLSGRSLIAVLITLWETRQAAGPMDADWALAAALYLRIARELSTVVSGPDLHTVRIALDDGTARRGAPDRSETEEAP